MAGIAFKVSNKSTWVAALTGALLFSDELHAQTLDRDMGSFKLKMSTAPTRTWAQGLVQPISVGALHGGLDFSHPSGFYIGQWAPSMGLSSANPVELDSYMGFKHGLGKSLSYEVGVMQYTYPALAALNTKELYAGLNVLGSRFGAAFSADANKRNSSLFANVGNIPYGLGLTLKYTNHLLDVPSVIADGSLIQTFNDWSVNLSRPLLGINLNLSYSDSNLSNSQCSAYSGRNDYCESMVMLKAERMLF